MSSNLCFVLKVNRLVKLCILFGVLSSVIIFMLIASLGIPQLYAEDVYRWTDEKGITHYSSSPKNEKSVKASLPAIQKEEPTKKKEAVGCAPHGGIDCGAGADSDGSVICNDGFRDADNRFSFSCTSAHLSLLEFKDNKLSIRNTAGSAAQNPRIICPNDVGEKLVFSGPKQLDGFGLGEFMLMSGQIKKPNGIVALCQVRCDNCP